MKRRPSLDPDSIEFLEEELEEALRLANDADEMAEICWSDVMNLEAEIAKRREAMKSGEKT